MRTVLNQVRRRARDERGAQALEFAMVAPVLLLLVTGTIYALVALASQVSLSHAATVGARYASMPTDPVHGVYPTDADVAAKVDASTPFFDASVCTTAVTGDTSQNAPLTLDVSCELSNPVAATVNGLLGVVSSNPATFADTLTVTSSASARRE